MDAHTREPIPFATLQLQGTTRGTLTDENGEFTLDKICGIEIDLIVSHVGYQTLKHHHDIFHEMGVIYLAPDDKILESVIIEGETVPTNMISTPLKTLSGKELEAGRSLSLAEAASGITGVSMISTGQNIMKPVIHGLHSNRVLIVNNGVRHEFQNWGVEHAPEIDPTHMGSLSIVKGAATVRYGPDALGGVILIDPPKLELHSGFKGELQTRGNTNGRAGEIALRLTQGWDRVIASAYGSVLKQGDLRAPDYILTNTGKRESSFGTSLHYHMGSFEFDLGYSHFDQTLGILRGSVNGNLTDLAVAMSSETPPETMPFSFSLNTPRQEVTHDMIQIKGMTANAEQDLSIQYAYQVNRRKELDIRRGANNEIPAIDLKLSTHSLDIDWNHPSIGSVTGSAGIQGSIQLNENIPGTNTVPFIPNYFQSRFGIFLIEQLEVGESTVEAGLRYDHQFSSIRGRQPNNDLYSNRLSFSQVTGSIGLRKSMSDLEFRSNLGTAWRPPNISELYSYGKHQASIMYGLWRYVKDESNNVIVGDILEEEDKLIKTEVGFKWINSLENNKHEYQWDIAAYANFLKNFIYMRPAGITNTVRGAFPYFVYEQTDAFIAGIDAALNLHPTEKMDIETKASYLWARDISNKDVFVEMPPMRMELNFSYEIPSKLFLQSSITLNNSYTFQYFQSPRVISINQILEANSNGNDIFKDDNSTFDFIAPPGGFYLGNIRWDASLKRVSWSLRLKNIFNTNYRNYTDRMRYFADQQGREFEVSLKYKF